MNSNEMTGIFFNPNLLELPKEKLELKRQRSYSVDKLDEIEELKTRIKRLKEECQYWKEKTITMEYEYKILKNLYLTGK